MTKKRDTLEVLAEHGIVRRGTTLELLTAKRAQGADARAFEATLESVEPRSKVIRWALDSELYTLTGLTKKMNDGGFIDQQASLFFKNWCRKGHDRSLWEEAEEFDR